MELGNLLQSKFSYLGNDLIEKMLSESLVKEFPKGTVILNEGQYVSVVPVMTEGLLKVYTRQEDREYLLYYLKPMESCVMSFMAGIKDEKSKIYAECLEDSQMMLLPGDKLRNWLKEHPNLNFLYFDLFGQRFNELMGVINVLLYEKLDKRILEFLKGRVRATGKHPLKLSHREIAHEIGSAREVVSRIMKKLESEGVLVQDQEGIRLLE